MSFVPAPEWEDKAKAILKSIQAGEEYDFGPPAPVTVPRGFARMLNGEPFPTFEDHVAKARPALIEWFRTNCLFCDEGETCHEEADADAILAIVSGASHA